MSEVLDEVDEFTEDVVVPEDNVDLRNAASVVTPFQALANRTKNLQLHKVTGPVSLVDREIPIADGITGKFVKESGAKIDASNELIYVTPKTRTLFIPATQAMPDGGDVILSFDGRANVRSASGGLLYDFKKLLPHGVTITRIRGLQVPGTAQSGTNRSRIGLTTTAHNFVTPGTAATSLIFTEYDNGTAAYQVVDSDATAPLSVTINRDDTVAIIGSQVADSGASSGNVCRLNGLLVTYTDPGFRR